MTLGDKVLFGGEIVVIRSTHNHATTGRPRFLIEHEDKTFSKVGAESLAPLEPLPDQSRPFSTASFLRQGAKKKVVLK